MDDIKEKLKEKKYQNWVKSTLGLNQMKRALHEFVVQKFTLYVKGNSRLLSGQVPLTAQDVNHVNSHILTSADCTYCTDSKCHLHHLHDYYTCGCDYKHLYIFCSLKEAIRFKGSKWVWDSKTYNCRDCKSVFEKIFSLHREGRSYRNIFWENSADTTQIPLEWAIAKVFMPQGNQNNKGPEDTDPAAMFHLMQMCTLFLNCNRGKRLEELTKARNKLFHSPDNLVTDQEQEDYFDLMLALLSDTSGDTEVPQVTRDKITEDIAKMKQLRTSDIKMTAFDDLEEALRLKRTAIYYDFESSLCENDPERLREILKIAEQTTGDLNDLKNVNKYKNEIDELRKQRDSVKTLVEKIPPTVDGIKESNRKLQDDINLMKTDLTRRTDEVQKRILDQLKYVPSNEKMKQLRNDATEMSADVKELKQTVQGLRNLCGGFAEARVEIGQWERALRVETSQLESEGMIFVIIVTVVLSLLFRILLFVG